MAHILVIEDYRDTRDMTELILADAGHTVVSACDGMRGIAVAAHSQPDLILMDLALPLLDGWETTRRLKASSATRWIPVVAFTAHVTQDDIARAMAVGCAAFVGKPFEIDTLLHQIEAVLKQKAPQQSRCPADHGAGQSERM